MYDKPEYVLVCSLYSGVDKILLFYDVCVELRRVSIGNIKSTGSVNLIPEGQIFPGLYIYRLP